MCGIFGYIGSRRSAANLVFDGLKSLEYRGYDSWGVSVINKGKIFTQKKAGKIGKNNVNNLPSGSIAIGHTRWATHGGATNKNAHPHIDCLGKTAVIHNGIFENYQEIKQELKNKHCFASETDTEVVVHTLEEIIAPMGLNNDEDFGDSFRSVFNKMHGLNAVISISTTQDKIFAAKKGSPLIVGIGKNENFIASDISALVPYTNKFYFLKDHEMAVLSKYNVKILNTQSNKSIRPKYEKINFDISQTQIGNFPNFMLKEIYEQPKIIREININSNIKLVKLAKIINKYKNIYLVGCGSAYFAALTGQYLFTKIASKRLSAVVASEFKYHTNFINNKSLVIFISQSGETMDVLEFAKIAKQKNAKIACLTNVFGSSLYRISDEKILIGAGPELAVASTKAMTGMIANLFLLAYHVNDNPLVGQRIMNQSIRSIDNLLKPRTVKQIKLLAKILNDQNNIFVIGKGVSYPTALESALKIKEISYIHAEGLAAGELKHGTIALIEKNTPCILFIPNDDTYQDMLNAAMELKARGAMIVGISNKTNDIFDHFIKVDEASDTTLLGNIIAAQLLSYFLAISKNLDPDKPRNLAKSVTVK